MRFFSNFVGQRNEKSSAIRSTNPNSFISIQSPSSCVKSGNKFYLISCLHFFLNVVLSTILLALLFLENDEHSANELKFATRFPFEQCVLGSFSFKQSS